VVTLSDIAVGSKFAGLLGSKIVTVTAVDVIAEDLLQVTYRDEDGNLGEQYIGPEDVQRITLVTESESAPTFTGDADEFRMVAEAQRIKYAALYDPFIAVNSSAVEPLPHQIRAVYEELLPKLPLRFLLADDPGAGKTIMAGLYLKELILRSDCDRALIVVPGGLVEQWRDELSEKFDLDFEMLSRDLVDQAMGRNVFKQHDYLIARMDQLARSEDIAEQLQSANWDVVIVDEAHRMSAHFSSWGGDVKYTKRFQLGRILSETAQNLLLMTATPHSGSEEDFQLFMSLLDRDRFEGKYREGTHKTNTDGIMRRMIKEELLTFEGKPLFPERQAHTIAYDLSQGEQELYEDVTDYVRAEMGRAKQIADSGDKKRGNNIGFALTVLQRRLASSPEAILRTLERRQKRLEEQYRELKRSIEISREQESIVRISFADDLPEMTMEAVDFYDEELGDDERQFFEEEIDRVVDSSTAAMTLSELQIEINTLEQLIIQSRRVRAADTDRKWSELRQVLEEQVISSPSLGSPHKIIIFTEHKDTLTYLNGKIQTLLGREEAIAIIHGGTRREDRKRIQERFTHNPNTVVLLATDAAGEGMNLQRAHLMVNYDLPWNPNRIEQRFGRIHRIGQKEVCHLWNLLADKTREGDVYKRLLDKLEQMGRAYEGKVFNVLGDKCAFGDKSLKDLLLEAILYGDRPEVRARLEEIIDAAVSDGLRELMEERALNKEILSEKDIDEIRGRMEQARERKLQPGYIRNFFIPAFERLGGRIHKREKDRYQITRVPKRVRDAAKEFNRWLPLADEYERIAFESSFIENKESMRPALIAPGNPLLRAVIELTIHDLSDVLRHGTVFIDQTDSQLSDPTLLYAVEQRIDNPHLGLTASRHFDYIELAEDGSASVMQTPPYLDYRITADSEQPAIGTIQSQPWLTVDHEKQVSAWAYRHSLQPRLEEMKAFSSYEAERIRAQVRARLEDQINFWYSEQMRLSEQERGGRTTKRTAKYALEHAQSLEKRLADRMAQLDKMALLVATPAVIRGVAIVIPERLLLPQSSETESDDSAIATFARNTEEVERRAVELALASERQLGRTPVEQARNNPGYDIRSTDEKGNVFFLEVKGRIKGAEEFIITANEVIFAQTQQERHRLVLVEVDPESSESDAICYVNNAFSTVEVSPTTQKLIEKWEDYWTRGTGPH
jgi:superfamily II DNA or RNA helicase